MVLEDKNLIQKNIFISASYKNGLRFCNTNYIPKMLVKSYKTSILQIYIYAKKVLAKNQPN